MKAADLPPGQRLFVVNHRGDDVEPGDLFHESGPRIGSRWWQVVHAEPARIYWHVACEPVDLDAAVEAHNDGATTWELSKP